MHKTILILLILLSLTVFKYASFDNILSAEEHPLHFQSTESLFNNLKDYFYSYYSMTKTGAIKSRQDVLKEIKVIIDKEVSIKDSPEHLDSIDDMSIWLDKRLEIYNKSINIFTTDSSDAVHCWLGDLVEEKKETKNIWGKEIEFTVKIIDNLEIKDFVYFLSNGKKALEVGTRDNIIYYNLEAYKIRANSIWDFFMTRETKNKCYDSSQSNRLRKKLYYKTWLNLYTDCVKDNLDIEKAKIAFIDKAITLLKENSLFHEVGHIYASECLGINDEVEDEIFAFLTELKYGSLPYETLDNLVSCRWQNSLGVHKQASDRILLEFFSYIENQQKKANKDYRGIAIKDTRSQENIDDLYKLAPNQIQEISEYISRIFFI